MQSSIWSHGHLEIEKNVQASDWLFLASPRFHVDPSNQFEILREGLGKTNHLQSGFCGKLKKAFRVETSCKYCRAFDQRHN